MRPRLFPVLAVGLLLLVQIESGIAQSKPVPRVIMVGVNGMEWDLIRPLIMKGDMPNLAKVIAQGTYGKLQTLSAPNCPKVYSAIATSTPPQENGITGFRVAGKTANTSMLKRDTLASILSNHGVSVGLANVPATFPAMPVNGYVVTGMLTRGKGCEDGILCAPKLSEVQGGEPIYPSSLRSELLANVGDFRIDCLRMPSAQDLRSNAAKTADDWLQQVSLVRTEQTKVFDYLLSHHPTDFTMMVQSCEDRTGHWLYPIQPHNVGYNSNVNSGHVEAFPDQYRAFDKVLGTILKYVDDRTYLFVISDHGIKPLREFEQQHMSMMGHDHGGDTPIIANHDFQDGDDVPGVLIVMGPNIKHSERLLGLNASVYDLVPTVLSLYGIKAPPQMRGRVLKELFEESLTANITP